ncbi:fatty acid desaturase [Burkholderia ambifaria]|nr:fatty acid desaturase [Burkholderia ambifaria]
MLALLHLYLIMHEALHYSVSNTRFYNEVVGHICGWIIGLPFLPRRRSHLGHHAWTAHPPKDPEYRKMIRKFSVMTEREARMLEFIWRHWIPMMAFNHFVSHWASPFQRDGIRFFRNRHYLSLLNFVRRVSGIKGQHERISKISGHPSVRTLLKRDAWKNVRNRCYALFRAVNVRYYVSVIYGRD